MTTTLVQTEVLPTDLQTVEEFENWQRQHVSEGSFEFLDGRIIQKESMKQDEIFIAAFLQRIFTTTASYQRGDVLMPESDSYVSETRKRVPDLTYFTAEEIQQMRQKVRVKSKFAIEILSDSESFEDVIEKVQDYFDAGGLLVWYIVPKQQKIYVYASPDESKAYKGNEVISAAPVIADFQFEVSQMFS
ncbi:Uma2 family endonuclease [Runella salmonicolor]|uniref:Uma2 family endonuclease n=1 Tax=Runella salmonicolor TaxID=2950278 RepID=A0ABT1FQI8_9BACT|nr:Uma2 family endonuclease [Runella salmonicolor]MCP1383977.1 Uma2 family endonuclease [Runella salmonicolor]